MGIIDRFVTAFRGEDDGVAGLFREEDGTIWVRQPGEEAEEVGGGGSTSPVQVVTARLTDAEIKALPTSPFQLLASQGEGIVILPLAAYLIVDTTRGVYTNIDANANFGIEAVGFTDWSAFLTALSENAGGNGPVSGLFAGGAPTIGLLGPNITNGDTPGVNLIGNTNFAGLPIDDAPLLIALGNGASGDLTGGDSANYMQAIVPYVSIALP